MAEPKKWKAGVADEAYKVLICGRDLHELNVMTERLCNLLTRQREQSTALSEISKMSGKQIVEAIEEKRAVLAKTIENGLARSTTATPAE